MSSILVAWVLLVNPQLKSAYTVSGIATEEACEKLADKVQNTKPWYTNFEYKCYSYEVAK